MVILKERLIVAGLHVKKAFFWLLAFLTNHEPFWEEYAQTGHDIDECDPAFQQRILEALEEPVTHQIYPSENHS